MAAVLKLSEVRLTDYHTARPGEQLPPVDETKMLDYVTAANGVFARGRRPGLEVCMPVSFTPAPLAGLRAIESYVQWGYPKVPLKTVETMLSISGAVCDSSPREALFYLSYAEGRWQLEYPDQIATNESVKPVSAGIGKADDALIELHSHHEMPAEFSAKDNEEEKDEGFRVFAVIGRIFTQPEIRARVGLFGHFWEFAAREFFELPEGLGDCVS